jgi:hypothetical protein
MSAMEDTMASKWDKIPSIPDLEVDWEYKPETSLGNRNSKRLAQKDLRNLFDVEYTPVKMITATAEMSGRLVDISQKGFAVLLEKGLQVGETGKVGFHLGKETIVSKVIAKNSVKLPTNHRVGMAFVGLSHELENYIADLVTAESFRPV